ncbi:MAG: gadC [Gammaproteobacteria bacterium]|jgi:putative glutamate/gamma-aminobutyrate antiporter|nr:gadC [Gammaproteobacteria bacterium]
MAISRAPGKPLTTFSLIMINIIAVDSLRNLTAGAEYGFALVFFYLLAAAIFFIPTILISAELATGWPTTGGVYVWVREAFGPRWGFMTIWLQWIYNIVWYPTIFTFMAGVVAYLIDPALVNNKAYMLSIVLFAFWGTTLINCLGLKTANWVTTCGALGGTLLPMLLIAGLGIIWLALGKPSQVHFSKHNFFPDLTHVANLAFLTNIFFSLMGMEMSGVHAGDVANPQRDYPRALTISAVIILSTLILSCLAITIVIPVKQLNLVSGLMDAFAVFFNAYHMGWMIPVIAILIVLGSFSGAAVWVVGPARGLQIAAEETTLPAYLKKVNNQDMPVGILLVQGVIVTALCAVFIIMPTVNGAYWVLSNLTAQLALIFYILMFAAAICLRIKHPRIERTFKIPGGIWGISIVGGVGIFACLGAIVIGFLPPSQVEIGKIMHYELILMGGMAIFCLIPWLLKRWCLA